MSNMNHCMCSNTLADLDQVLNEIEPSALSEGEMLAAIGLLRACARYINNFGEDILLEATVRESDAIQNKARQTLKSCQLLLGPDAVEHWIE